MWELIFEITVLFFALISLINFFHFLFMLFLRPKQMPKSLITVTLDYDLAEEQFLYFMEKYRWNGKEYADEMLFITERQLSKDCLEIAKEYEDITVKMI